MVHDMIEIEKMGKPAVPIVSGRFEEDAIASARAFAMPDLQFVIVPRIYRNLAHDECIRQTEAVIDDLVHVLTHRDDHKRLSTIETADRHRFEGADRYEAVLRMNEDFIMRDWAMGFRCSRPPARQCMTSCRGPLWPPIISCATCRRALAWLRWKKLPSMRRWPGPNPPTCR